LASRQERVGSLLEDSDAGFPVDKQPIETCTIA